MTTVDSSRDAHVEICEKRLASKRIGGDPTLVRASRCLRKMRGESQAHLLEGFDGGFYVTKFANNPQGRRTLVNDMVASLFFAALKIKTAETVLVLIEPEFLRNNPEMHLATKRGK